MRIHKLAACFLTFLALSGFSFSQVANSDANAAVKFIGKWRFIPEKSFRGMPDRNLYSEYVVTISEIDSKIRIMREYAYNSVRYSREVDVYLDGRGETNDIADSNGVRASVKSKTTFKKGIIVRHFGFDLDQPIFGSDNMETFRFSKDGKHLVVERRYRPIVKDAHLKQLLNRIETDQVVFERVS